MFWLLNIILEVIFGVELCFCILPKEVPILVVFSLGIPIGFGFSTLIFFITGVFLGPNMFHLFINMTIVGILSFILFFVVGKLKPKLKKMLKIPKNELIVTVIYSLVSLYIIYKTYFKNSRSLPLTMEVAIHEELSLQSSFLYGVNSQRMNIFKIKHPNYSGKPCVTRWLTALHASMLRIGKASIKSSIIATVFLEMMCYLISMFYFTKEFNVPLIVSVIAPFIALNIGGFGFFDFLIRERRLSRYNDYITDSVAGHSSRFHPLIIIYLGSLPTIYALSVIAPFFYFMLKIAKKGLRLDKKTSMFIGFSTGILLMAAQHQAYFGVAVYFGLFVLINMLFGRKNEYFALIAISFLIGSSFHLPRVLDKDFISSCFGKEAPWSLLYKKGVLFPAVDFWMGTYGTFQLVLLIGFFFLEKNEKLVFLPSVICFIIFTFWKLTSSCEYNSVTIFCIFMVIAGPIYGVVWCRFASLTKCVEMKGAIYMIGVICGVINCTASVIGIFKQWKTNKPSWSTIEEITADWVIKKTPKDAIFAVPRIELELFSALAGRQVFLESINVARSIGYDFEERENILRNKTHTNVEGLEKHVNYIAKMIAMKNDSNDLKLTDDWKCIYSNREYEIYKFN